MEITQARRFFFFLIPSVLIYLRGHSLTTKFTMIVLQAEKVAYLTQKVTLLRTVPLPKTQ